MTRMLWILGLSIALFVFGGWTVLIVIAWIARRHLNTRGFTMLIGDGYVAWITFQYLLQKIRERKSDPPPVHNDVAPHANL
jgi:hypothetical protein